MDKITIRYSISRTVALVEGRNQYGTAEYFPSDAELAFLSVDERKYLDGLNLSQTTFALPAGAPPVWPTIADSIKAARQAALDRQAAEVAEREQQIVACLAEPDEKWISDSRDWHGMRTVSARIPEYHVSNYSWGTKDPRIVARLETLEPEVARRKAEAARQNVEREAQRQAEAAASEQRKADAEQAKADAVVELTKWCIEHGPDHLKRGAADEYDVTGGLVQWLAECLRDELNGGTIVRDNTKLWGRYDWNERKSPGPKAFELLDAVAATVEALERPTSVTIEVERIMLVEVEPPEDECDDPKQEFTAVVVNIMHPAAARRCLVIEVK